MPRWDPAGARSTSEAEKPKDYVGPQSGGL